jgi:VanZ family protein
MNMKHALDAFRSARAWAWVWTVTVLLLHAIPRRTLLEMPGGKLTGTEGPDKAVHVILFAVWAALWSLAVPRRPLLILAAGLAYGAGLEVFQQTLIAGRSGSVYDLTADAIGLVIGVTGIALYRRRSAGRVLESEAETTAV